MLPRAYRGRAPGRNGRRSTGELWREESWTHSAAARNRRYGEGFRELRLEKVVIARENSCPRDLVDHRLLSLIDRGVCSATGLDVDKTERAHARSNLT